MQLNKKFFMAKCNPLEIRCNIAEGTRQMAGWKRKKNKKYHWLRHYNWRSKQHYLRVLWIREAYRFALNNRSIFKIIRSRRYARRKLSLSCIKEASCGLLKRAK
jgi:hypothetical protein